MKKKTRAPRRKKLTHSEELRQTTEALRGACISMDRILAAAGAEYGNTGIESLVRRIGTMREKAAKYDALQEAKGDSEWDSEW